MDKNSKIQDIFKRAEELSIKKKIKTVQVLEENTTENLPTEYVTANGIMLSSKETMTNTNFLNRLDLSQNAYKDLTFTKEQAKRIQSEMARLTTGVIGVTPLTCLGPKCRFAKTCISVGTSVSVFNSKSGYKNIEDLLEGDIIYSFNTETKTVEHDKVLALKYMGYKKVYEITTHTGLKLKCTADHPILTEVDGKVIFRTMEEGLDIDSSIYISDTDGSTDDMINSYGDLLIDFIESIDYVGKEEVYDISVQNNQNFFASNICVHNCPLEQENKAPIGKDCWIEVNQIQYWMEKYIIEFNVDGNSLTDLHMIAKLCEYDILEMRATKYLKENDQDLLTDFISSYDEAGNPISNKSVSPAFELKERVAKMRSKTMQELMATREAKAKIIESGNAKKTTDLSSLKEQLNQLILNKEKLVEGSATRLGK